MTVVVQDVALPVLERKGPSRTETETMFELYVTSRSNEASPGSPTGATSTATTSGDPPTKTLAEDGSLKIATGFVACASNGGAMSNPAMKSAAAPRAGTRIASTAIVGTPRRITMTTPPMPAGTMRTSSIRIAARSISVVHGSPAGGITEYETDTGAACSPSVTAPAEASSAAWSGGGAMPPALSSLPVLPAGANVPPALVIVTIVEPIAPNDFGEPSGSVSPPWDGSTWSTSGRFDSLSTVKVSVARRPVPPAPGGDAPLVTQPRRMATLSMTGATHVTARPLLPRNGPFVTETS